MQDRFRGLTVLDERPEEAVLSETEERLRKQVEAEGLETVSDEDAAVHVLHHPIEEIGSSEDLEEYLERCSGFQELKVSVYAEGARDRSQEVSEPVDARVDLENGRFLEVYEAMDEDFDVENAGFCLAGYGEDAVEAYESAVPVLNFLIGYGEDEIDVTVSYRDGGTVETFSGEADVFREVYDNLRELGLVYDGTAVEGDESTEWIVVDDGAVDTRERR